MNGDGRRHPQVHRQTKTKRNRCSSTGLGPAVGDHENITIPKSLSCNYMRRLTYVDIQDPSRFSSVVEQLAAVQQVIGSNPVADFVFWWKRQERATEQPLKFCA